MPPDTPSMIDGADPHHPSGCGSARDQKEQDLGDEELDRVWIKGYGVGLSTGMMVGSVLGWVAKKTGWGSWAR